MDHGEDDRTRERMRRQLVDYFASGAKPVSGFGALGVEVEHFVLAPDGVPVAYEPTGEVPGIRDVLEHLATWYPRRTHNGEGDLLGLDGEQGSITLEPAAQLELSAAPFERVADVERAYADFREHVGDIISGQGLRLHAAGYHPTRRAQELTRIPKRRYDFMDDYFTHIGSHGDRMMRASASTQVSVDFTDEADAVRKMRVTSAIAPVLAAIADNTRVFEAESNHVPIRRLQLWREVDRLRCGTVPGVFDAGFGFAAYADWLLRTPPIFVTRPAANDPDSPSLRAAYDTPAAEVYADAPMGEADLEHLMSMFWPDVRLKRFVEIRPADCMPPEDVIGYAALIKGLYYSESSLAAIEEALGVRCGPWPLATADVDAAIAAIARDGFAAEVYGWTLEDWEEMLFTLALNALPTDERHYLDPLVAFARDKDWWEVG